MMGKTKKIGAIDPKLKAEIDWIHAHIDKHYRPGIGKTLGWYFRINELAKRI